MKVLALGAEKKKAMFKFQMKNTVDLFTSTKLWVKNRQH